MKKKILFVIESLTAAGAERSLISLLSALDYSRYDIDLQLFSYGGEFERYLPKAVRLLPPLEYSCFIEQSFCEQLYSMQLKKLFAKNLYSFLIRIGKNSHADRARKYWKSVGRVLSDKKTKYDAAVAYSQGIPSFYVAEKVCALNKIAWVNVTFSLSKKNVLFQRHYYNKFQHIVCVSSPVKAVFDRSFPDQSDKTIIIRDRIDSVLIHRLAEETPTPFHVDGPVILTVARLAPQKGYDTTLKTCRILRDRGVRFHWYAIGRGPLKHDLERYVKENDLQQLFSFLGTFANPYPYFKAATLYVQTSRNEGFGLSIAEARVLGVPIVTTEFDAVWQQMVQGKNGLVVPQDPVAVADAIERLLKDKSLYNAIVSYQRTETFDNSLSLNLFYRLLE